MSPSINHSDLCRKIILAVEQTGQWKAWPEPAVWTVEPCGQVIYMAPTAGRQVQLAGVAESEGVRVDFTGMFSSRV